MADAAYYRAWRAAHPEYRARQRRLRAERRRRLGRGDRSLEYARRGSRAVELPPIPALHTGHPLFDAARRIVPARTDRRSAVYDPLPEDLLSVATLALVEGVDPRPPVARYRAAEIAYRHQTLPLFAEAVA